MNNLSRWVVFADTRQIGWSFSEAGARKLAYRYEMGCMNQDEPFYPEIEIKEETIVSEDKRGVWCMTHEPYLTDEEILVLKYRPVIAELAYKAYQAGIRPTDLSGATYEPDMDELKKAYFKMLDFEWDEW